MKRVQQIFACSLAGLCAVNAAPPSLVDASAALAKEGDPSFYQQHQKFLARAKRGPIGVLFLGDSITAGWAKMPRLWKQSFGKYQPANFGISGDQTQHVIWRIEHGELDGINPRVVVLLIGTNNSGVHSAEQIIAANTKIVGLIREKLPDTKVLLLAIFPRGPHLGADGNLDSGIKRMEVITATNAGLAKLDDGQRVRFLDLGAHFLDPDGTVSRLVMPDGLHLNLAGYQRWAEALRPRLDEMMK